MKIKLGVLFLFIILITQACEDDGENVDLPVVSTNSVMSVSTISALTGGNVTSEGGSAVLYKGVCWSTSQNPTVKSDTTNNGAGIGSFTTVITGLVPNTTYYVRAYATNRGGTAYGNELTFATVGSSKPKNSLPEGEYPPLEREYSPQGREYSLREWEYSPQ